VTVRPLVSVCLGLREASQTAVSLLQSGRLVVTVGLLVLAQWGLYVGLEELRHRFSGRI